MGAYEELWLQQSATFQTIADRFAVDPMATRRRWPDRSKAMVEQDRRGSTFLRFNFGRPGCQLPELAPLEALACWSIRPECPLWPAGAGRGAKSLPADQGAGAGILARNNSPICAQVNIRRWLCAVTTPAHERYAGALRKASPRRGGMRAD